ncbi:MAG TPA: YbaN family protein [Acidimicrobiia bacterium]|nr:YbaN family protein [Acidimicrobiia bacterium]
MGQAVNPTAPRKARSRIVRGLFFVLGLLSLVLLAFSWLPGIPTFDMVLLAAFFFSMSSDRMYGWMVNHPYFGKIIKGYRQYGLTMRAKWTAAIAITLSLLVSGIFLTDLMWLRLVLIGVGIYALWFVFSRPTRDPSTVV